MKDGPNQSSPGQITVPFSNNSLEYMAMLLDNVSDAVISFDKDKKITFWNKGAEKIYGWSSSEAVGKNSALLLRSEADESLRNNRLKDAETKGELIVEAVHYTKENKRIVVESRVIPLKDHLGEITGYTVVNCDITRRKKAEDTIRESEERFRVAQELSPDGFLIFRPLRDHMGVVTDFLWIYENDAAARMNDTNPREVCGKKVSEVLPHHDQSPFHKAYKEVAETAEVRVVEDAFYDQDTFLHRRCFRAVAVPTAGGDVAILVQNVTERKVVEDALRKSEAKLLEAQKLAHVGSFTYDIIKEKIEWSEETYNIYEIDPKEDVPPFDVVTGFWHPEDLPWVSERIKEGMAEKKIINFECRLLLPGNKVKYINYIARGVYGEDGKPVKRIGAVADITDRKLIQLKLEEALTDLREKEEKLNEAQKLAHIGSFNYDIKTRQLNWSEEMFNIYGLDPEKGAPEYGAALKYIHPEDIDDILQELKKSEENKEEKAEMEFRIIRKNGEVRFLHYIVRPEFDNEGKHTKRFGTLMDITDIKLKELELRKTLEELKRSNHELEQFAYVSSHDLQEPLRMVSMYTRMLEVKLKDSLDEKTKEYMYFITDGAKRMYNLIQDLLAYSRVTSRQEALVLTDLNGVMAEVLRDLQVAIADHNAEIVYEKLPEIKADPSQIKLVFQNLIQNAIKFRGKDKPVVQIYSERKPKEWLFCIKDNGIGIDPECYEKIFVIFQRLHEKEKYPGTGIGLSICRKIVERHGGKIWVESEEGKGSKFFVTIPV